MEGRLSKKTRQRKVLIYSRTACSVLARMWEGDHRLRYASDMGEKDGPYCISTLPIVGVLLTGWFLLEERAEKCFVQDPSCHRSMLRIFASQILNFPDFSPKNSNLNRQLSFKCETSHNKPPPQKTGLRCDMRSVLYVEPVHLSGPAEKQTMN